MNQIIIPVAVLSGLGVLFALILAYAANAFHVEMDKTVTEVRAALPGANCGGCGFPGCDGLAEAIALKGAAVDACPVGGASCAEEIARIMGKTADIGEKEVACVLCQGDKIRAKDKYIYQGIQDCRANQALQGGNKSCAYGCLGCGTCQVACKFGAIEMVNGLAIVDKDKCTSCRMCVNACPKQIIEMIPYSQESMVKCKSRDLGKVVRQNCTVGCIACGICAKQYPEGFIVEHKLARTTFEGEPDREKLDNAIAKCPTKCIYPGLERKAEQEKEAV